MNQWKVRAYTGKNRNIVLGCTYVRALTEAGAIELGRKALKIIGIKGRYQVEAIRYSPLHDLAFVGYIKRLD